MTGDVVFVNVSDLSVVWCHCRNFLCPNSISFYLAGFRSFNI